MEEGALRQVNSAGRGRAAGGGEASFTALGAGNSCRLPSLAPCPFPTPAPGRPTPSQGITEH